MKRKIRRLTRKSILYATMTIHEVRALEAYLRRGGTEQSTTPQTVEIRAKSYVVLSGVRGI
ncbi:MAG: hypothetical protein WBW78_15765, partial [Terrimicrobiaceae bacterium]